VKTGARYAVLPRCGLNDGHTRAPCHGHVLRQLEGGSNLRRVSTYSDKFRDKGTSKFWMFACSSSEESMALCHLDRVVESSRRIAAIVRSFHGAGIGADNCTLWPVCFTPRGNRALQYDVGMGGCFNPQSRYQTRLFRSEYSS
jgi:hypothetical protein